jgi:CRP-like cAMP-binding protein
MSLTEIASSKTLPLDDNLAAAWLTNSLSSATRGKLARMGRLSTLVNGQVLMREGEPTDYLAIVLEGRIGLRVRVPERGPITILTVEPGDVVGWSAVVPPFRATSTAVALAPTELAVFEGPQLREVLASDAELAAELYPVILSAVSRRLEGTRLQLLDLFSQRWVEPW